MLDIMQIRINIGLRLEKDMRKERMRSINADESEDGQIQRLPAPRTLNGIELHSNTVLPNFEEVVLQSTNSINDSANHLFGLMKGLNQQDEATPMTAVELAKQLANLARVKLDYIKLMKK